MLHGVTGDIAAQWCEKQTWVTRPDSACAARSRGSQRMHARCAAIRDEGALVRHRHPAVVDQIVDRRLHVDVGLDHAGLLQREAGRQDRLRFCGAPILLWVSSVRSLSCLSTTASGSLVAAMNTRFTSA